MRKVAVVTDSSTCLTSSDFPDLDLLIVPVSINFEGKSYLDGVDITPGNFYKMLGLTKSMPTTSQPSAESFNKIYKHLISEDFDVLAVVLSSKVSGTWNSAMLATEGLPKDRVEVFDTLTGSLPEAMIAIKAAEAAKSGASLLDAKNLATRLAAHTHLFFAVDTLEYLHRGGRIGSAAKFIGNALEIKPILTVRDGYIVPIGAVRTTSKARTRLLKLVEKEVGQGGRVSFFGVTSANASVAADDLLADAQKLFQIDRHLINELSPAIGVHMGAGAVGVVCMTEE